MKKPEAPREPSVTFGGSIERVIFHNADNGYSILRIVPDAADAGRNGVPREGLTCVGTMLDPQGGMKLRFSGNWVSNPRYGRQFAFSQAEEVMPAGNAGLVAYLSSGLITGVGPDLASRIVKAFGDDTVDILDNHPERLDEVRGIGKKNGPRIIEAWQKHRCMCGLMQLLQSHGISPAYGVRIYNQYKGEAVDVVTKDPYRLAMDVRGIGFVTADSLASRLGVARDNPMRVQAGVLYLLQTAAESGHVYLPGEELVTRACEQLGVPADLVLAAVEALSGGDDPALVVEDMTEASSRPAPAAPVEGVPGDEDLPPAEETSSATEAAGGDVPPAAPAADEGWDAWVEEQGNLSPVDEEGPAPEEDEPAQASATPLAGRAVYLKSYHLCESRTAYYLHRIKDAPRTVRFHDLEAQLAKAVRDLPFTLAPAQMDAVRMAAQVKVMVLTGGPGTGKTTIIKAILALFSQETGRILLAAPTGRAAKRMAEATEREASTLHRLLEYNPASQEFGRNEDRPLACDLLVVDEASMMDITLFYHLLKAVPVGAVAIFVGDIYQLPSVGPGAVLSDIITSRTLPVAKLDEIFRQNRTSDIILNAHLVNHGQMPVLSHPRGQATDFYFMPVSDPEEAAQLVVDLASRRLPRHYGFNPFTDIQVLTPMHKGAVGAINLNHLLQEALNPNGFELRRGERRYRVGDKVMQIRNNYERDVFNGDMGCISSIDTEAKTVVVAFDGAEVPYAFADLDEIVPAYAISIHKSQGSEYPAVVIPLLMSHYIMLQRNLIYTGITRGKKLVVLVGEQRALSRAVANNETVRRCTRLAWRLSC